MYILRAKLRRIFHVGYGSFFTFAQQSIIFCIDSFSISNPASTHQFDLKLGERFDLTHFRFQKHSSFALFCAYLCWSLNQGKLFNSCKVAFPKPCPEFHWFWAIVDNECFDHCFLACEKSAKIERSVLISFVIDYETSKL